MDIRIGDIVTLKPVTVIYVSGETFTFVNGCLSGTQEGSASVHWIESVAEPLLEPGDEVYVSSLMYNTSFTIISIDDKKAWVRAGLIDELVFIKDCQRV